MNFATTRYFSCLCETCHNIAEMNLLAEVKHCPVCKNAKLIAYDDPRLSESHGEHDVVRWDLQDRIGREVVLTDGNICAPRVRTCRFASATAACAGIKFCGWKPLKCGLRPGWCMMR